MEKKTESKVPAKTDRKRSAAPVDTISSLYSFPAAFASSSKKVLRSLNVFPLMSDKLFDGVKEFHSKDFIENREIFRQLQQEQHPHTLFIGCSDSRVVPSLITKSLPGELFIVRNIANIVPVHNMKQMDYVATSAVIEYAVKVLEVENIIICGHSNCGGCQALYYEPQRMRKLPQTRKWLSLAKSVKNSVKKKIAENPVLESERSKMTEQLNIVQQMNHLLTYPYLRSKYQKGQIRLMGWYYAIETGDVYNYSVEKRVFEKIS